MYYKAASKNRFCELPFTPNRRFEEKKPVRKPRERGEGRSDLQDGKTSRHSRNEAALAAVTVATWHRMVSFLRGNTFPCLYLSQIPWSLALPISNPEIVDLQCYARCRRAQSWVISSTWLRVSVTSYHACRRRPDSWMHSSTLPCVRCDDRKRKIAREDIVLVRTQDRLLYLSLYTLALVLWVSRSIPAKKRPTRNQ